MKLLFRFISHVKTKLTPERPDGNKRAVQIASYSIASAVSINLIRDAAYAFIESLRRGDRVAVLSFQNTEDENGKRGATIGVQSYLTDDREALRGAVQNIGSSNGTPYYDALERLVKDVFRDPLTKELRGRRALVALTDGVDSTSVSDFASVRAHLLQTGLLAYFVQVDTEEYVENRLLVDCQDDRRLRLSRMQLAMHSQRSRPRLVASTASAITPATSHTTVTSVRSTSKCLDYQVRR